MNIVELPFGSNPGNIQYNFDIKREHRGNGNPLVGTFDYRYSYDGQEVGKAKITIDNGVINWHEFFPVGVEDGDFRERQQFRTAQKLLRRGFAQLAFSMTLLDLVQNQGVRPSHSISDTIRTPEWYDVLWSAGLEPGEITPASVYVTQAVQAAIEKKFSLEVPQQYRNLDSR